MTIRSERLELVPATPGRVRAALEEGDEGLARAVDARVPAEWPPELYDDGALRYTLERLERGPEQAGWWLHWFVAGEGGERVLVGAGGYKGPPDAAGTVEVGYTVVPAFRRRGYATEATRAMVEHAFARPGVTSVIAETLPELLPSIGVLEKLGFRADGEGSEPGVVRYRLSRPEDAAARPAASPSP